MVEVLIKVFELSICNFYIYNKLWKRSFHLQNQKRKHVFNDGIGNENK